MLVLLLNNGYKANTNCTSVLSRYSCLSKGRNIRENETNSALSYRADRVRIGHMLNSFTFVQIILNSASNKGSVFYSSVTEPGVL